MSLGNMDFELDTRPGQPAPDNSPKGIVAPGDTADVEVTGPGDVPETGVYAVVINVTIAQSTSRGYVTAFPKGATQPNASNINVTRSPQNAPTRSSSRLAMTAWSRSSRLAAAICSPTSLAASPIPQHQTPTTGCSCRSLSRQPQRRRPDCSGRHNELRGDRSARYCHDSQRRGLEPCAASAAPAVRPGHLIHPWRLAPARRHISLLPRDICASSRRRSKAVCRSQLTSVLCGSKDLIHELGKFLIVDDLGPSGR
jgi:hypothetical protein